MSALDISALSEAARQVRIDVLTMIHHAGSGNPGSALSCVEILTWLLLSEMKIDPANARWDGRDRLILSKGQAAPVFYSLAARIGWISRDELSGFRCFDSRLQSHPDALMLDCVDCSSGSLGQGLSSAVGMAIAARLLAKPGLRFFCLLGDGELQEGQVWEAAMAAGHYRLGRLIAIVDNNRLQGDRATDQTLGVEPLRDKWEAFGWEVATVADGHSYPALATALAAFNTDKPKVILVETVKGKGVDYMENDNYWHTAGKKFDQIHFERAIAGLQVAS